MTYYIEVLLIVTVVLVLVNVVLTFANIKLYTEYIKDTLHRNKP